MPWSKTPSPPPSPNDSKGILPPRPDQHGLQGVIPVGESLTLQSVEITLLSIERYTDCFLAHMRVDCPGGLRLSPHYGTPLFSFAALDDQDNRYDTWEALQ